MMRIPATAATATAVATLALLTGCSGSDGAAVTHHRTPVAGGTATSQAPAGRTGAASSAAATAARPRSTTSAAGTATAPDAAGTGAASGSARAATTTAAPRVATHDDGSRTLTIPVLGVDAPVTSCATSDGTVTPPSNIDAVCRWTGSQPFDATTGTTIVVGHSTRSNDTVGALEYIRELKVGDTARVAGQTWRVVEITPGVDKHSLPTWIVDHSGPRQLGLVTCETTSHTRNDLARLVPVS